MALPLSIAVYFTIWWVVLFVMLPIGVHAPAEADGPVIGDKGAPVRPMMLKKALATTLVAAVVFAMVDAYAFWAA